MADGLYDCYIRVSCLGREMGKQKGRVVLHAKNIYTFSREEGMSGKFTECFWVIKVKIQKSPGGHKTEWRS